MAGILNFIAYQIAWLACVLGAAWQHPTWGMAFVLFVVALHLVLAANRAQQIKLILCATGIGLVVDTLLIQIHTLRFTGGQWLPGIAPYWMLSLWSAFATTFTTSLSWLMRRPWLAAGVGAVGGPLAYAAGARLGALSISAPISGVGAIATAWAIAMWLLATLVNKTTTELPA